MFLYNERKNGYSWICIKLTDNIINFAKMNGLKYGHVSNPSSEYSPGAVS